MKKTAKTLLISSLALCLSTAVVVGATYALFTGKATVNNHLKAGNLTVGLLRTSYQEYSLNGSGLLTTKAEDTTEIDLTKDAKQLFTVSNAVPKCWYQATVNVSNDGSVAFDYGMRILWNENSASKEEKIFAEQIEISVTYGQPLSTQTFLLSDCAKNELDLGYLLKDEDVDITVKATFKDDAKNDLVQNEEISFDLQVFATQKTGLNA